MSTLTAYVNGVSFWAPRLPGWQVAAPVLRGEAAAPLQPATRPVPTLLGPTERRRAPDTVAIALEVASRACESAGVDPKTLPSIFASTHGDLAISDYMSETLARTPTLISPIRFHNSVHNAAAGYWTIGTGCYEPYTALTAYEDTFGEGLLEALTQAACGDRATLLVAYDIEARGPLATMVSSRGLLGAGSDRFAPCTGELAGSRSLAHAARQRQEPWPCKPMPNSWRAMPWRRACRSSRRSRVRNDARSASG